MSFYEAGASTTQIRQRHSYVDDFESGARSPRTPRRVKLSDVFTSPTTPDLSLKLASPNLKNTEEGYGIRTPRRRSESVLPKLEDFDPQKNKSFAASRLTMGDYFTDHYEDVKVSVCNKERTLLFECTHPDTHNYHIVKIHWDDITGLDFQYTPLQPVLVVIELGKKPDLCPQTFKSVVYFLFCSKTHCERYLDQIMLANDTRLFKLAVMSLPTWSVIVNRYSIPVLYNYRIRHVVTWIVNMYILISLIMGFWDLYKGLPYVGNLIKTVLGPIGRLIEPLRNTKLVLLIPLLAEFMWSWLFFFITLFKSFVSLFVSKELLSAMSTLLHYGYSGVAPIFTFLYQVGFVMFTTVLETIRVFWELIKLPFEMLVTLVKMFASSISYIVHTFQWLVGTTVGSVFGTIKTIVVWIVNEYYKACSISVNAIINIGRALYYPIQKVQFLFAGKAVIVDQAQQAVQHTSTLTQMWYSLQDGIVAPIQRVYSGFRRIIDWVIHVYHTSIKHRNAVKQRIMIVILILVTTVCVVSFVAFIMSL